MQLSLFLLHSELSVFFGGPVRSTRQTKSCPLPQAQNKYQ